MVYISATQTVEENETISTVYENNQTGTIEKQENQFFDSDSKVDLEHDKSDSNNVLKRENEISNEQQKIEEENLAEPVERIPSFFSIDNENIDLNKEADLALYRKINEHSALKEEKKTLGASKSSTLNDEELKNGDLENKNVIKKTPMPVFNKTNNQKEIASSLILNTVKSNPSRRIFVIREISSTCNNPLKVFLIIMVCILVFLVLSFIYNKLYQNEVTNEQGLPYEPEDQKLISNTKLEKVLDNMKKKEEASNEQSESDVIKAALSKNLTMRTIIKEMEDITNETQMERQKLEEIGKQIVPLYFKADSSVQTDNYIESTDKIIQTDNYIESTDSLENQNTEDSLLQSINQDKIQTTHQLVETFRELEVSLFVLIDKAVQTDDLVEEPYNVEKITEKELDSIKNGILANLKKAEILKELIKSSYLSIEEHVTTNDDETGKQLTVCPLPKVTYLDKEQKPNLNLIIQEQFIR